MNIWNKQLFFLILAVLACHRASAKDREAIATPPPLAKPGSALVYLGEAAEVSLNVGGRIVEPLSFLIRKPPRHGVLSNLRRTGRTSAVVTYVPDPAAVPGDDSFTFAAQSPDSPVSAPASVWLSLLEKPPVLEFPAAVDFGTVFLGDTAERELDLRNSGGGQAIGKIQINPPWSGKVLEYRIPSGSEKRIRLVFRPTDERDFSDRIRLGDDPMASVELRGTGAAPLTWPKAGLVFSPEQRTKGFAEVALANQSPQERTLAFEWPGFVKAPREVSLPPGATVAVRAEIIGPIKTTFQGSVPILSGNFSGQIPLTVYPKPAKLVVIPGSSLELGEAKKGKELRGKFLVRNTGESDASLRISVPDGMLVVPDPGSVILGAGEERWFEVLLVSFKPGPLSGKILVRTSSGEPVQIDVKASVREGSSLPVEKFLNIPEPVRAPELPTGKVPPTESASLILSTPHEIKIGWDLTSPETTGYKIQRRKISSSEDDRVLIEWLDWPVVKTSIAGGKATASWERLPENACWTIRIIGLDALGKPGPPSSAFQISTQPRKRLVVPAWAWLLLLGAAAAGAVRLASKRRRALLAREDKRLARLEAE